MTCITSTREPTKLGVAEAETVQNQLRRCQNRVTRDESVQVESNDPGLTGLVGIEPGCRSLNN